MSTRNELLEDILLASGTGHTITRWSQVSNAANSVNTSTGVFAEMPLIDDGPNQQAPANEDSGKCQVDLANNWIDVANCHADALFSTRITVVNNAAGTVTAVPVMRLQFDRNNLGSFVDIVLGEYKFEDSTAFPDVRAFNRGVDVVKFGIVTTQNEDVRFRGVLFEVIDK